MNTMNIMITVKDGCVSSVGANEPGVHVTVFDHDSLAFSDRTYAQLRQAQEEVGLRFPHDTDIVYIDHADVLRINSEDTEGGACD